MNREEFEQKRIEIYDKCNRDIDKKIEEMKNNGSWISGLCSDPSEIQKLKDEAFAKLRELAKEIEE